MKHAVIAVDAIKQIQRHLTSNDLVDNPKPRRRKAQKRRNRYFYIC